MGRQPDGGTDNQTDGQTARQTDGQTLGGLGGGTYFSERHATGGNDPRLHAYDVSRVMKDCDNR